MGHPEETGSNLASAGLCFGDFVVGIVADAWVNVCLPKYDLLFFFRISPFCCCKNRRR